MYLSIIVAAVASFAIGMLWYGPLFGKVWMKEMGMKSKKKSMDSKMMKSMAFGFVSNLVMAYVLKAFVMVNPALYLNTAVWLWLGFQATGELGSVLWEGRSWKLFTLNVAHALVTTLVMAWVLVTVA